MLSRLKQLYDYCKSQRGLRLIVVAAVLLQVILAIQHFYAHRLLEKDLERDAEREMIMKSVLIKGILKSSETALLTNEWSMQQALHNPDSVLNEGRWILESTGHLEGCGIAFVPYYYPSKGRLYELYVHKSDGVVRQIAGPGHDYTQMEFYKKVIETNQPYWSDPYVDTVGNSKMISTFSVPLKYINERIQ